MLSLLFLSFCKTKTKYCILFMASVEARHLNLLNQQRNLNGFVYNTQMGSGLIPMPENYLPKTSVNTESGLTFHLPTNDVVAPRKRSRDSFTPSFSTPHKHCNGLSQIPSLSFVGDDVLPLVQQYQLDINSIISHHTKKIRLELEEQQKHQSRMLVSAVSERVMKKMKEKDEQIQRIGKINQVLQEKLKTLYMENQLWRDLAQTNEATANSLRSNLEQVLAHVTDERLSVEEDAESCCGSSSSSNNNNNNEEEEDGNGGEEEEGGVRILAGEAQDKRNRMCRRCGERESCVLLLPCRHLCLCTVCGSSLQDVCPVCNSNMNATVHVNMSS
ncbi:BOI-related E3 ubiquitin-protein ligase 1 [Solanum lycopersicum]|uniref:BOI-related E3 ubiquitin-protein ligase 1 n=1 Tax=Solanum lycopersicum TaxID=4081 RepID=UPI0037490684